MTAAEIRTATRTDTDKCVALIALAFSNDPAARWAYKDPVAYLEHFPAFVRAFSCAAFDYGTAHHIEGSATALWIPPGVEPDEGPLVALIEASVPASDRAAVLHVLGQMGEAHPQEPHWYLPLIGTDPAQQGRGHGSALLRHALAIFDADQVPAYLEATSPRNVALYQRHGFEITGTIQAGDSPTITPMVRRPR
jgi:ribosomal protein S18 acetylase RimI-like enzyme